MQDLSSMLHALSRPRLLIRAARIGARDYSRNRHLRRLLHCETVPRPGACRTTCAATATRAIRCPGTWTS